MNLRRRYLPLTELQPDMVLARPLVLSERGRVTLRLPAGHVLTETSLAQLEAHHAEYACIDAEDSRTVAEKEEAWQKEEERLAQIFRFADLNQPEIRTFYNALLVYRKS